MLFDLSYDFVGDLSETVALLWPRGARQADNVSPSLTHVIETLDAASKLDLPRVLTQLLNALDETGRWALLKLITGALRVGVSARLAKQAVAELGGHKANDIEDLWHGLTPPYLDLFAWLEGREDRPNPSDPARFCPAMLAHAITDKDLATLMPADFSAEWKWDGIRVQAAVGEGPQGENHSSLFAHRRRNLGRLPGPYRHARAASPAEASRIDGELLIMRAGRVQSFGVLQQRLNRKQVTAALLADFPAHIRAYDLLTLDGEDVRALPFAERRQKLEAFVAAAGVDRLDLSPQVAFESWDFLAAARRDPATADAGADAAAIEGIMLKRQGLDLCAGPAERPLV